MDAVKIPPPPLSAKERLSYLFMTKVVVSEAGCWEWTGAMAREGYGRFSIKGKQYSAHRFSAYLYLGFSLSDQSLCVCHHCDNRRCVNPHHLFLGTKADNTQDCLAKGRMNTAFGERSGKARLTEEKVREARRLFLSGVAVRKLARDFGMSNMGMSQAIHGQTWKHVA